MNFRKKNRKASAISLCLVLTMLFTSLPLGAVFASEGSVPDSNNKIDAMTAIDSNDQLREYKIGDTQSFDNDGYIGIPYEVSVYYDHNEFGPASPNYATLGGTPVIMYVVNADFERIGTDSDTDIILSLVNRGYAVVVLNYLNNAKAKSPDLDWSAQLLRDKMAKGDFFTDKSIFPQGTYAENVIAPSGYDVLLNQVYFELDKHGTDGTLEKIVEIWNTDFRNTYKDVIVRWVHDSGERKAVQNGCDGSAPVWYSDGSGNTVDAENGVYTKVQYTKAESITDCVKSDGTPIDLNLYYLAIYPTNPKTEAPVMVNYSSAGYLNSSINKVDRPQFVGFLFNGYAGVCFDYGWVPMGRDDHYGHFDGATGVTGDSWSYSIYNFNATQIASAGIRYTRYLALSDPDTYAFKLDGIGIYGISKAAWMNQLGAPELTKDPYTAMDGSESQVAELVNSKLNSFYQLMYYPGHHGESRYDNGITDTYTADGAVIDGGELQPWIVYDGYEILSGVQMIYSSCGAVMDYINDDYDCPLFISVNIDDNFGTAYNMQHELVNLCKTYDIPNLWYEANISHTFAYGKDAKYGVDTYDAFFRFADYYLKGAAVKVSHVDPGSGSAISPTTPITIKFIGEVTYEQITRITVKSAEGSIVNGRWESFCGNTEWVFTPYDMVGNTAYTLTVPADVTGANGVPMGADYVAEFYTLPEISCNANLNGALTVDTNRAEFSITVPEAVEVGNRYDLRIRVDNDAVNTLCIYDNAGDLAGEIRVSGAGYYEFDVTKYLAGKTAGQTVSFRIKTQTHAGSSLSYEEDFTTGSGSYTESAYSAFEYGEIIEGNTTVKITRVLNSEKYKEGLEYYETNLVLTAEGIIDENKVLTKEDMGRTFIITVRVYDTVSRPITFIMNHLTNRWSELLDYDRSLYYFETRANEWCEFSFPYTVYEAKYGATNQQKKLQIQFSSTGDSEMPLYVDSLTVEEIFTDVSLGGISLVSSKEGSFPYKADESDSAFEVNGTKYDSWSQAINTAASGSTVKLLRSYELTDVDLVKLSGKNSLTVDLNGYRLIASNTRYAPLWLGSASSDSFNITVKNGEIILADTALIAFNGSSALSEEKNVTVILDSVYITVTDNALTRNVICNPTIEAGATVSAEVRFINSEIDITREYLPDRAVSLLPSGSGDLKVRYSFEGGKIVIDSLHELEFCTTIIGAYANSNGEYFKVLVSDGAVDALSLSFKMENEYANAVPTQIIHGYKTYSVVTSNYSTPYGAIPDEYADVTDYPFAVFHEGVFLGACDSLKNATSILTNVFAAYPGSTVTILLRDDHYCEVGTTTLAALNGSIVVDLDGNTIVRNTASALFECGVNTLYTGGFTTSITVKNGTLLSEKGHLFAFKSSVALDKQYYISFDRVTFGVSENCTSNYTLMRSWGHTSTGVTNVEMSFRDCIFDFAGNADGSKAPSISNTRFIDASDASLHVNAKIYGGELHYTADSLTKVTLYNKSANGDSIVFLADNNGEYATLTVPSGVVPGVTVSTDRGDAGFTKLVSDGEDKDVYTIADNPFTTEYGIIPADKTDTTLYPFAVFANNQYLGSGTTLTEATNVAKNYLSSNVGGVAYILLRDNYDSNVGTGATTTINGTLVIDLGGNTVIRNTSSAFIECGIAASYSGDYSTSIIVKNGVLLAEAGHLIAFKGQSTADKQYYLTFEAVTFGVSENCNQAYTLMRSWGHNNTGVTKVEMTFRNCVFDFAGKTEGSKAPTNSSTKFLDASDASLHVTAKIYGGVLHYTADTLAKVTLYNISASGDSVTFYPDSNGSYAKLTVPNGVVPELSVPTDEGTKSFTRLVEDGAKEDVYALPDKTVSTEYGVIPGDKTDVTLYPFAVFANDQYLGSGTTLTEATNVAKSYLSSNVGGTVYILLRDDYLCSVGTGATRTINGTLVIDLGGNTVIRNTSSAFIECGVAASYSGDYSTSIIVKNGVLLAEAGHLIAFEGKSTANKQYYLTFEEVTFGVSKNASPEYTLMRCWGHSSTGVTNVEMTFKNCVFDFAGRTEGSQAPTHSKTKFLDMSNDGLNVTAKIYGGVLHYTADTLTKVTLYNMSASGDSITFYPDSNGSYATLTLPNGVVTTMTLPTDKGTGSFISTDKVGEYILTYCVHVFDNDCDAECNNGCGYVRSVPHNYSENILKKATTFEDGLKECVCDCGHRCTEVIPATKSLKILAIGNSFSQDALAHLYIICKDAGIETVVLANLFQGGCTLEMHLDNMQNNLGNYTFYLSSNETQGLVSHKTNATALYGIEFTDWDFITLQQGSPMSGVADSYSYIADVIAYVNSHKNNDAQLLWHMTWAYQSDSTHSGFKTYDHDQMQMYNAILSCVQDQVLTQSDIIGFIPSGTAIQNLRTSHLGDTLTRDGYHLSYGIGRYTAALTYLAAITGYDISKITVTPTSFPEVATHLACIKEAVINAIRDPYNVTVSVEYPMTEKPVSTEYGVIPPEKANVSLYPFAIFANGKCIGGADTLANANKTAKSYISNNPGATVYILLRDYHFAEKGAGATCDINGTLVIDLGGNTLIGTNSSFIGCGVSSSYQSDYKTNIIIKNGVLLAETGHLIAFEGKSATDKQFSIVFENVTFGVSANCSQAYTLMRSWGHSAGGVTSVEMTFNNCTFDFAGTADGSKAPDNANTKFLELSDEGLHVNVVINGGKILYTADSMTKVTFYKLSANGDSVKFNKDEYGNYFKLTLPAGLEAPTVVYTTVNDENAVFLPTSNDGEYLLTPCTHYFDGANDAECNVCGYIRKIENHGLAIKVNLTLGSDIRLNLYTPKDGNILAIYVNGNVLDLGADYLEGGITYKTYYLDGIAPSAAMVAFTVTVEYMDGDDVKRLDMPYSILTYAKTALATASVSESGRAVVRDMLGFIKAAYDYFGNENATAEELSLLSELITRYPASAVNNIPEGNADTDEIASVVKSAQFDLSNGIIRLRLNLQGNASPLTVRMGDRVLIDLNADHGKDAVLIELRAYELTEQITMTSGELSGTYSFLDYAGEKLGEDTKLDALLKSMYAYSVSAAAYRAEAN